MKQKNADPQLDLIPAMNANRVDLPEFLEGRKPLNLGEYWAEEKFDGNRALLYFHEPDATIHVVTRGGKDVTENVLGLNNDNAPALVAALGGLVLDCEILPPDGFHHHNLRSALGGYPEKGLQWQVDNGELRFEVFDLLRIHGQRFERSPFEDRRDKLEFWWDAYLYEHTLLELSMVEKDSGNFRDMYIDLVADGGEGIMLKHRDGIYYPGKRKSAWLKVKRQETYDWVVTGFTDAEELNDKGERTKFAGLVGAVKYGGYRRVGEGREPIPPNWTDLDVETIGQCSGMDNATRQNMTDNPDLWLGKVIEISGQQADPETHVIRHPSFVRVRDDKDRMECIIENP